MKDKELLTALQLADRLVSFGGMLANDEAIRQRAAILAELQKRATEAARDGLGVRDDAVNLEYGFQGFHGEREQVPLLLANPWIMGRNAAAGGAARDDCPFEFESESARAWRQGYDVCNKQGSPS